jgi:hypothetical protein
VSGENLRVTRAELAFRAIAPGDLDHAVGPRADPLYNSHEPAGANQAADYDDVVQLLGTRDLALRRRLRPPATVRDHPAHATAALAQ